MGSNSDVSHSRVALERILVSFFFVGLLLNSSMSLAGSGDNFTILDGVHKFSSSDEPLYSLVSYDDSLWSAIEVPGSWQSQQIRPAKGIGWYRIHFSVPERYKTMEAAVLLGRIGDADEVFLNGGKIGSEGLIGEAFVEATKAERLYRIPRGLLKYNADNVLAVRVMNTYLNGGIFDRNILIGDYAALLMRKLLRERSIVVAEFCFFTLFTIFFVTCLFFYIKGLRDREYVYFWLFLLIYSILFLLGSVTFYNTSLKTSSVQKFINFLITLLPASLILLLVNVYQQKLTPYIKTMLLVFLSIALGITFTGGALKAHLYAAWRISFIVAAGFLLFLALKAYLRKYYESGPVLLGVSGLVIGLILESVGELDLLQFTGFFLWDYSAAFFMFCVMYALTARYKRIKDQLESASVRIFNAHEDERRRLARELHDGVGQSLLSVKLHLQMLGAKAKKGLPPDPDSLQELVSNVHDLTNELRAISHELRPSFLDNIDVADAMRWHAAKMQETSGMQIFIRSEGLMRINPEIKDNIYRIYQETLGNAIKHSGGTRVDVSLVLKGNTLSMEIRDNGKGFDPAGMTESTGMGLHTMKERAELLGGFLDVRSSRRTGTTVSVEVPVG